VAGRTDAGVHASGQVIHVDIPQGVNLDDIAYKLNRILDEDIRIMQVSVAPEAFHARFSAIRRTYTYKILDKNLPVPPINRTDIASWYRPLDAELMNVASGLVLGHHDFAAFCKFKEGGTTIRTLENFTWERRGELLVATIIADAFCYSMVRNLVGAVVCVADGRKDSEWIRQLLQNKERVSDSLVFPARGLTLSSVEYPTDNQLLERAKVTIGKRDNGSH
jgi:tRNA pseudouridine38-40 synthase